MLCSALSYIKILKYSEYFPLFEYIPIFFQKPNNIHIHTRFQLLIRILFIRIRIRLKNIIRPNTLSSFSSLFSTLLSFLKLIESH